MDPFTAGALASGAVLAYRGWTRARATSEGVRAMGALSTGRPATAVELASMVGRTGAYTRQSHALPGQRTVPILVGARTPMVPRQDPTTKIYQTSVLAEWPIVWRAALAVTGRADEDWRCTSFAYTWETGYDVSCWGHNTGNRKIVCGWDGVSPVAWAHNPNINSVLVLRDAVDGLAFFAGYASHIDATRDELRFFSAPRWAGVLTNYRTGGLAGLQAANRARLGAGYASDAYSATQSDHDCASVWSVFQSRLGAAWSR